MLIGRWFFRSAVVGCAWGAAIFAEDRPTPPGRLIELGGWQLHLHCSGKGSPTVVVEPGLGDLASDWVLVQLLVSKTTRICTYDRAGYGFSSQGPQPRTYSQINLDLHRALEKAGEHAPFLLVGHSFGGPAARWYAKTYPGQVAGMVFVDTVHENQRIMIQGEAVRLRATAKGGPIPPPHENLKASDQLPHMAGQPPDAADLGEPFNRLPGPEQAIRRWAVRQPSLEAAQESERTWSPEYLQKMYDSNQEGSLGDIPLMVLTRAKGGYPDLKDVTGAQLDQERMLQQKELAKLSTHGQLRMISAGHNMHLEAPAAVAQAIGEVVLEVRRRGGLSR